MDEFDLIREVFRPLSHGFPGSVGLTDDVAILHSWPDRSMIVTVDTIVGGVHFLPDDPADLIARKLIRVNLSDLAAKGAVPHASLLALSLPSDTSRSWIKSFGDGLSRDLNEFSMPLIGGDTVSTSGPVTASLTTFGLVHGANVPQRGKGRVGDDLWVSGTIGDAYLGLMVARGETLGLSERDQFFLKGRYHLPQPRLPIGTALLPYMRASMDVSDGLIQDLGHLCRESGCGAVLHAERIPYSVAVQNYLSSYPAMAAKVVNGGDDYEILFSADSSVRDLIAGMGLPLSRIGSLDDHDGIRLVDRDGHPVSVDQCGWRHFG